ncbi:hypothetical protein CXB51_008550 [Gossypium anomalum]|uniref:DUF4283 domain-containing protein n=1 Tax=Gossypium anomalum TaxID=47600 RepID=A0A8J6D6W9_9ROSI|nr:hypothetical protein CXB51_008550 [Gossypium anomalum]
MGEIGERGFAALSLDDEEEEVVQVQKGPDPVYEKEELCLVGCFLTASVIHFPVMRNTMANIWHPVKGVQISDLGEKTFLFRFFHRMDLERVLKGSLWSFNTYLILVHHLGEGEDLLKVPLIFANSWVQIHDVPPGYFSKALARQMRDFIGKFLEYDGTNLGRRVQNHLHIRIQMDVRRPLRRKKNVLVSFGICSYVSFKYKRLTLFYFFCGRLGHIDSFYQAKMDLGFEVAKMGWDLSLRAQSRRTFAMGNVWLRGEGRGEERQDGGIITKGLSWVEAKGRKRIMEV